MMRLDRRVLIALALTSSVVLLTLGIGCAGKESARPFDPETRSFLQMLTEPLPEPPDGMTRWAEVLVLAGDPRVFGSGVLTVAALALAKRDKRLACVAIIAPVLAEVLTQEIAKPGFGRVRGDMFAYPSGHVTAATGVAFMAILWLLRHGSGRRTAAAIATIAMVPIVTCFGVVVMEMHDTVDAFGGLAMAIAVCSAWALTLSDPSKA